ncbi:MAG: radical SAM protein [Spirochaetales bacterium]|nr:radical SAM protein [Spirochaetales bacterium]
MHPDKREEEQISRGVKKDRPLALLVVPPVYDFALYDLYLKPYGLLRIGRWLVEGGWDVVLVNGLDYTDPDTASRMGFPRRKPDGTGKFFRSVVETPAPLKGLIQARISRGEWKKHFARYGIDREVFLHRLRKLEGENSQIRPLSRAYKSRRPDLIFLATGMTYWYPGAEEAAFLCKELYPEVPLIVGGVYATLLPEHCHKITRADLVVSGENITPLSDFLSQMNLPTPVCPVPLRPLPLRSIWADAGVIRLNTGCPFHCTYCASRLLCPSFIPGNPGEAITAFRELRETCGTRNFAFYDDALLFQKEKVLLPFLDEVIRDGLREKGGTFSGDLPIRFYLPNGVHLEGVDRETVCLMRRAGVAEIRIGLESTSTEFHQQYDRKVNPAIFPEVIAILKEAGYKEEDISVYILAGLPGQEAEEVEESIRFVKKQHVRVRLAEYSPIPGTALWENSIRQCSYPLAEEPLFHNNSLFALEGEKFSYADLISFQRYRF